MAIQNYVECWCINVGQANCTHVHKVNTLIICKNCGHLFSSFFHVLQLLPIKLTQQNLYVAFANLRWSIKKYQTAVNSWIQRRRRTSMQFHALRCHSPKMAGFQWNRRQKFSTLPWTPLALWKTPSESYAAMHAISCWKCEKWLFKPTDFIKRNFYFETEGVCFRMFDLHRTMHQTNTGIRIWQVIE